MTPNGGETINKYVGDFLKEEVDNYLHIHKEVAEILENKIKESERERKAMAGVTKLARERAKKANLHNRKLRDCRIHFSDAKNERKEESSISVSYTHLDVYKRQPLGKHRWHHLSPSYFDGAMFVRANGTL